ncbi:hypothetical protein DL93DRAFT_1767031 [Clavulina sp. PMI_390]|nr:hypothetical protein DL93DRAFT_1767031 [Clavulina sp. PMI_390]
MINPPMSTIGHQEFLQHPQFRTIASFFVGWAFMLALYLFVLNLWHHHLASFFRRASRSGARDIEEKSDIFSTSSEPFRRPIQAFRITGLLVNLSIVAATLGMFVSLLSFPASGAVGSCGEFQAALLRS